MVNKGFVIIDGMPVAIEEERNLLEMIRKAGIKLPTFCYHSELSVYGACRMCIVETKSGNIEASCSTIPRDGMEIKTNTQRLRKHRKMLLELLLANHCGDCTSCANNGKCKLQDLAMRFGVTSIRFPNTAEHPPLDTSSRCITRDQSKCILCGDCVRVCNETQDVGAIDFAHRGSNMKISVAFDGELADSPCVGCGQCAAVCPTGAIIVRDDTKKVWDAIDDFDTEVTVQIAPAVRVALGRELGVDAGGNTMGMIVSALKRMGFDQVYDTATAADLTVMEETAEFVERISKGEHRYPLFTSCCPAWINFCESRYPELMENVSTCKSPMQMFAAVVKEYKKNSPKKQVHVAVMPCTAKKHEAGRDEFKNPDGEQYVDYVITTQELIHMVKESGIVFRELIPEAIDKPFGAMTGAGVIFGVTGGVTEAVLRRVATDKTPTTYLSISYTGVRGMQGVKEAEIQLGDRTLKIAMVSGLKNAVNLIEAIKAGAHYDFVEVMACPGGCVSGAGQPFSTSEGKANRGKALYSADRVTSIKSSEDNPIIEMMYKDIIKDKAHDLLHVHYNHH